MDEPFDPGMDGGGVPRVLRVVIDGAAPARLDKALARAVPEGAGLSRAALVRLIRAGAVSHGGRTVTDCRATCAPGEAWLIRLPPSPDARPRAEAIPLAIIFEDADLLVVDKAAGMVIHPAPGTPRGTLVNALLHHCGEALAAIGAPDRPGIVHRLDKDTTGLVVVAKSAAAHEGLSLAFREHRVHRQYLAICRGVPSAGDARMMARRGVSVTTGGAFRIETGIGRHPHRRQRQAVLAPPAGRVAITEFDVVRPLGAHAALIRCRLVTGRTHQIRVHLAHAGHPLLGDPVYGGGRLPLRAPGAMAAARFPRQALHAAELGFDHPVTGAPLLFRAPLPPDMEALIFALDTCKNAPFVPFA